METEQLKLPWPIAREYRTDGVVGIPVRCRTCWHREGRMCFNDKLKEVPTEWRSTGVDAWGQPSGYTARLGNELTDDHVRECMAFKAHLHGRSVIPALFAGIDPINNEFGGGAP